MTSKKTYYCWKTRGHAIRHVAYSGVTLSIVGVIYYFVAVVGRLDSRVHSTTEKATFFLWFGMLFIFCTYLFAVIIMVHGFHKRIGKILLYYLLFIFVFEVLDLVLMIYIVVLYKLNNIGTILDLVFFLSKLIYHLGVAVILYLEYRVIAKEERTKRAMEEANRKRKLAREAAEKIKNNNENETLAALEILSNYSSDVIFVDEFISRMGMERLVHVVEQDAYIPTHYINNFFSEYRYRENLARLLTAFLEIMDNSFGTISWDICTPLFTAKVSSYVKMGTNVDKRILGQSMSILENLVMESEVNSRLVTKELPFPDLVALLPRIDDKEVKENCAKLMNALLFRFPDIINKTVYDETDPPRNTEHSAETIQESKGSRNPEVDFSYVGKRGKEEGILLVDRESTPSTSGVTNCSYVSSV
ncbi:uncharacterized protein [Ptychodera flava]|uniref:uncharacterized protein n=1 Tax=Ptychodera flava TaxID=63121 RepID=UPI003969E48A